MKILCCNPIFFEYRLPFYVELNRLFNGEFHVLFSPLRMTLRHKEKLIERTCEELGHNAHLHRCEHVFDTDTMKWDVAYNPERGRRIPLVWGISAAIRRIRPDILLTVGYFQWTPLVLLYGVLHGIPVYMSYERTPHTERNRTWLHKLHRKLFNRFFSGYLVNGSETRKYLESLGAPASKIHVAGMSADSAFMREKVQDFRAGDAYAGFKEQVLGSVHPQGLCFLFNGKLDERKGVTHLLESWRIHIERHPHDHLVMVGMGKQYEQCRAMAADMPSVHIEGWCDYEKMPKYYAIADVSIMPTLEDNWSLVVPEAMACGLPVTTSIYNGCHPELIQEGTNGYVFDTLKHETIVDVLDKFHSSDLESMGKASIELEKHFNTENSARRVYDALRKSVQK